MYMYYLQVTYCVVKRSSVLSSLTSTQQSSYDMFIKNKMSVDKIAKDRILEQSVIMNHLASALEAGYFVDYRKGKCITHQQIKIWL